MTRFARFAIHLAGIALVAGSAAARAEGGLAHPSPWEACRAWGSHIGDLIDQHRIAHEIDEETLGDAIRRFDQARSACSQQRFDEALAAYEAIPLAQVRRRPLR